MKLKALFIGSILALGCMSFNSNDQDQDASDDGTENTCQGSEYVCTASPGKFWK